MAAYWHSIYRSLEIIFPKHIDKSEKRPFLPSTQCIKQFVAAIKGELDGKTQKVLPETGLMAFFAELEHGDALA